MLDQRMTRRVAGMLATRLTEAGFEKVHDPRWQPGVKRALPDILTAVSVGMAAGCKSLAETEDLTERLSPAVRKRLGIAERFPDTTLRNTIVALDPDEIRRGITRQIRKAHKRKALQPDGLDFGVLAMDGKVVAIKASDDEYSQAQSQGDNNYGLVRLYTAALVSSLAVVCIDAAPVPPSTNEMGHFKAAFDDIMAAYGDKGLFRLVATDAGACSKDNADHIVQHSMHYLLALKKGQHELWTEARRLLAKLSPDEAVATTEDVFPSKTVTRRLYLTQDMAGYHGWQHLRTVLRVESELLDRKTGQVIEQDEDDVNRYYLCSLLREGQTLDDDLRAYLGDHAGGTLEDLSLSDDKMLHLVRRYWAVENQCHHTWDTAFREDDKPWIVKDPKGAVVLMLLRRLTYNALALFRSVTQRSDEKREVPWKRLLRDVLDVLIAAREQDLVGMRLREAASSGT
jgi:predicted transposase YbfD/YdcC